MTRVVIFSLEEEGIEGYSWKVNCFTFQMTRALAEPISVERGDQRSVGEEDSHHLLHPTSLERGSSYAGWKIEVP